MSINYRAALCLFPSLALGLFVSTAAMAQTQSRTNSAFSAGDPGGSVEKPVGSCNSPKGCHALKRACLKTKGHSYTPTESGGLCDDGKKSTAAATRQGATAFVALGGTVKDATCVSVALCKELRNTCQGDYTQISVGHGVCKD